LGEKDITEKTLASYNDVFSDIVNGLLFEGRPVVNPDALADVSPYSMYKVDGRIHEQERDVSKFLKTGGNTEHEIRIAFFVNDYKVNLFEIAFMNDTEISRFHSDFRIVADFMAHKRTDPDYVSTDKTTFVHTDEILKLMSLLTDDDRYELTLNLEGGKPKNMCEMLDRVEAKGMEKGEDMVIALLKKLTPGSEDYNKALNASPEERRELYKKYGIA